MKKITLSLFLLCFVTYGYFFHAGSVNENAHLDQTRAIVDLGRLAIDPFSHNTHDTLTFEGKTYPNKIPGLSFLAVPQWWSFKYLMRLFQFPNPIKEHWIVYFVIWTTVGFLSALLTSILFLILARITEDKVLSLFLSLAYALGTIAFPFSTLFFAHQPSAAFIFFSFACIFYLRHAASTGQIRSWVALLGGFCGGYALTIQYPNALAVMAITLYVWIVLSKKQERRFYAAGLLTGASFLLFYNFAVFHKPFFITYSFLAKTDLVTYSEHRAGFAGVVWPKLGYLAQITFLPQRGLFYLNPWLMGIIPSALLFPFLSKKWRLEACLATFITVGFILFNAGFGTSIVFWGGGFSTGPRHIIPMLPFATLLIGLLLKRWPWLRWPFYPLCLFSIATMLMATAVDPRVPYEYLNPLKDYFWPCFLNGYYAPSTVGPFGTMPLTNDTVAFNLGKLCRLQAVLQLLPLYIFWFILFTKMMRGISDSKKKNRAIACVAVFLLLLFLTPIVKKFGDNLGIKKNHGLNATYYKGVIWPLDRPVPDTYKPVDKEKNLILKTKVESQLNFSWFITGMPYDFPFSVEWSGYLFVEHGGTYTFATDSDDGSSIYIDGKLVLQNWGIHPMQRKEATITLKKGWHPFVAQYYNEQSTGNLRVLWKTPKSYLCPIHAKYFIKSYPARERSLWGR